jgi:gliding motility-associated protein GldM
MAGGKLTPRQKMINLMYLVFIAMLALNMSKEVLSAFGILNTKIVESNAIADVRNTASFDQLAQKAADQPGQFGDKKEKVQKIRKLSEEFSTYLEDLKTQLTKKYERKENGDLPFEEMDKGDDLNNLFFKGDKLSAKGQEFLDKRSNYVSEIKKIGGSSIAASEMKKIENRFETNPVKSEKAGATLSWIDYNYKGYPLIASITKFSQLQADIKTTENDIMAGMFQTDLIAAASLTAYQPIVILDKTAYFQGEAVTGKVILGKFDPSLKAKSVVLNGANLKAESGQASFSFGAGNVGEKTMTGSFNFDENGKVISLPINGNYVVVPRPNSATISADKMNVVYRGVDNPITVTFAGISSDKVKAQGPGLSASGGAGKYVMKPGTGKEVIITAIGTLPDGKPVTDKKVFRIKGLPNPTGKIRGEVAPKGPTSNLENCTITAELEDFDFPVTVTVTQFTIKVPGEATIVVNGNKMDGRAKSVIKKAKRGDVVVIGNIKASFSGISQLAKATSTCTYEIQ